jgi:hypothetical protein
MSATHGSNLPKLTDLIPVDLIKQMIDREIAPLKERATELIGYVNDFIADNTMIMPGETEPRFLIEDDGIDSEATEILGTIAKFITKKTGRVDMIREAFKRPILDAGNAIGSMENGPFAAVAVSVEAASQAIIRASINYKAEKATRIRREAEAEAKRKADEAEMAERLASAGSNTVTMADAAVAAQQAEDARQVATARPADLTRTHGDQVGTTSLKYKPDHVKIAAAMGKPGTPFPVIAGVTFEDIRVYKIVKPSDVPIEYCEPDLTVRR